MAPQAPILLTGSARKGKHGSCAPGDNEIEAAMATTDNNLHIPDDLLAQAEKLAASQGRTANDLAADALNRYLAHEWLNKIEHEGQERQRQVGLKTDEEVEAVVERAISEYRNEQRGR
jgi:hypothetical protein